MASDVIDFAKQFAPWLTLGLGVVMGGLRAVWSFIYEHTIGYAITKVSLSLTVEDTQHRDAYTWLSHWVEKNLRSRRVNSLLLRSTRGEAVDVPSAVGYEIIPEYGSYYMSHGGRLMTVDHYKEQQRDRRDFGSTSHTLRLRIWLSRDRSRILKILEEARQSYERARLKRVEHFRWDGYSDWNGGTVSGRSVDSLFHLPGLIEDLMNDVRGFLDAKPLYAHLGIPYRRGYLFAGPPGTGKSSLILAVASQFQLPVYVVPLRGADITGDRLAGLLAECRKPSLISLEDVDCLQLATSRESKTTDQLTIADLLNVIDGIGATEDRVLFMTTNRPEVLDSALTRAGRVDRKFFVDYARDEELRSFYDRTAQYFDLDPWPKFRAALPLKATIADAQALALQATASSPSVSVPPDR